MLKPTPIPQRKAAASDTVPLTLELLIVITNCAQSSPFNTNKERAFSAAHLL